MVKSFEDFLILIEQNQETLIKRKFLLSQLLKRKLYNSFEKNLESSMKILEQVEFKDEDYYLNKFFIETLKKDFLAINKPVAKLSDDYQKYSEQVDNLIYFFMILMLKEYMHIHNRTGNVNYDVEYKFCDEILSYIEKKNDVCKNERLINLFTNFLKIYDNSYDETLVEKLKELLKSNKPYIKKDVYNFLIVDLYNYCMDQDELGREEYRTESLNLMNEMLENDVLINEDGYLSGNTYRNIAAIALRFNQFDWANNFIENYKDKMRHEEKENSYYLTLGAYYSKLGGRDEKGKKNFYQSLRHLTKVKTEDYSFMSRLKNMQIYNYYNLEDYESVSSVIDSYRHYLKFTKQIPRDNLERALNFLRSMGKLIKIIHGSQKYTLIKLKDEINSYKTMDYKLWMLNRIVELEKNPGLIKN